MDELIKRWQRAIEKAHDEKVRVIRVGNELRATSSSLELGTYELHRTPEGWTCECRASQEFGIPCKHLAALAELLDIDVLADVRLDPHLTAGPPSIAA